MMPQEAAIAAAPSLPATLAKRGWARHVVESEEPMQYQSTANPVAQCRLTKSSLRDSAKREFPNNYVENFAAKM